MPRSLQLNEALQIFELSKQKKSLESYAPRISEVFEDYEILNISFLLKYDAKAVADAKNPNIDFKSLNQFYQTVLL